MFWKSYLSCFQYVTYYNHVIMFDAVSFQSDTGSTMYSDTTWVGLYCIWTCRRPFHKNVTSSRWVSNWAPAGSWNDTMTSCVIISKEDANCIQ